MVERPAGGLLGGGCGAEQAGAHAQSGGDPLCVDGHVLQPWGREELSECGGVEGLGRSGQTSDGHGQVALNGTEAHAFDEAVVVRVEARRQLVLVVNGEVAGQQVLEEQVHVQWQP